MWVGMHVRRDIHPGTSLLGNAIRLCSLAGLYDMRSFPSSVPRRVGGWNTSPIPRMIGEVSAFQGSAIVVTAHGKMAMMVSQAPLHPLLSLAMAEAADDEPPLNHRLSQGSN